MLDRMEQIRKDLDAADRVVRACWDNFIATEPTFVLRDLIVIEIQKAREAAEARIKDLEAENAALLGEAQHIAGYLRRVAELEGAIDKAIGILKDDDKDPAEAWALLEQAALTGKE